MPIYVYETIPARSGEKPNYYEVQQSMTDEPLTKHPCTGESIRRVILGGFGVLSGKKSASDTGSGCCEPGCCRG